MSPALRASARHWIFGTTLAFAGVAVARLGAPACDAARLRAGVALAGELTALAGLAVIMIGIRRRLHHASTTVASTAPPP